MKEDKEAHNVAQDTEQPDHITRSVMALARRTRGALSSWVQRCLGAEHESSGSGRRGGVRLFGPLLTRRPERAGRHRRHRQTAFTAVHTRSLVGRVQRVMERGTVWRPDVGSIKPTMVTRFARSIVDRFSPLSAKYQLRPSDDEGAQGPELPLFGGLVMPDSELSPSMERTTHPASPPTTLPPSPPQTAPKVQRMVKPPTPPKGARLFSQVEELSAERKILIGDESLGEKLAQVEPAQAEQETDTSASPEVKAAPGQTETPPEPGRFQSQIERKMPDHPLPRSAELHRIGEPALPSLGEKTPILARATSPRRLPLTKPPPLTHRQVTAHLVTRGWRFKRKESSAPAAPSLVARAVDDLERPTSPGRPLEHKPRAMMESVLGRDFSDVRIHTARLAPLNVQAATRGRDVYVESGQDRFDTPESLSLLGHELTHAVQGSGVVSTRPVAQMAILPQAQAPARLESEEAEAESTEQTILELSRPAVVQRAEAAGAEAGPASPASLVGQSTSMEQAQRPPFTSPSDLRKEEEDLMETAEEEDEEGYLLGIEEEEEEELSEVEEEPEEEELDLDRLARQVYPFIKRLLTVERERMAR